MPTFLFLLIWVAMFGDRDAEANPSTNSTEFGTWERNYHVRQVQARMELEEVRRRRIRYL